MTSPRRSARPTCCSAAWPRWEGCPCWDAAAPSGSSERPCVHTRAPACAGGFGVRHGHSAARPPTQQSRWALRACRLPVHCLLCGQQPHLAACLVSHVILAPHARTHVQAASACAPMPRSSTLPPRAGRRSGAPGLRKPSLWTLCRRCTCPTARREQGKTQRCTEARGAWPSLQGRTGLFKRASSSHCPCVPQQPVAHLRAALGDQLQPRLAAVVWRRAGLHEPAVGWAGGAAGSVRACVRACDKCVSHAWAPAGRVCVPARLLLTSLSVCPLLFPPVDRNRILPHSSRVLITSGSEGQLGPEPGAAAAAATSGGGMSSVASVMSRAPQKYLIQNQSGLKVYYWSDGRVSSWRTHAGGRCLGGTRSCAAGARDGPSPLSRTAPTLCRTALRALRCTAWTTARARASRSRRRCAACRSCSSPRRHPGRSAWAPPSTCTLRATGCRSRCAESGWRGLVWCAC